ncbi:MAG TPA: hypothetical protein VHZ53_04165 [Steroidobacteraceae bacterium]|jgi:hypothetical protein|nr:hypothetical protein [Steroidobacteraceae bacterium]
MNAFDNSRRWREFITAAQSLTTRAASYPAVLEAVRRSQEWFSDAAEGVRIRCTARLDDAPIAAGALAPAREAL